MTSIMSKFSNTFTLVIFLDMKKGHFFFINPVWVKRNWTFSWNPSLIFIHKKVKMASHILELTLFLQIQEANL